ncbi:class I SAM-dependent DNA methyltransferase [Methylobacterium sp. NEAU 140]|uniref:class I SAM-dependent DNA methyltransferase n=1 Tax=Methylobacterium sp. NEAU 140 TaxID=3064945 RepID=UPI0027364455|nr:DNA methyltransferase [Methylobacterium sp. NEAU 140]MDP4026616.1 class I SAM-dependent DNA methyltransferase [Methylobacterium sp. NEAU 140]
MRFSWGEIRARAATFADEWKDASYEKGETHSFYNDLFEVFGVKRRKVASFEEPVKLLGAKRGFIDLFWKGVLLVEQKSKGRSLLPAKTQALDYFPGLKDDDLPRYILLSDFQSFELHDLEEDAPPIKFKLHELPSHVEAFAFILGVQRRTFKDQDPVNIKASEIMGELHDALKASGYTGEDLERYLVRLLFCLFADDTGIFEPRDIFSELIRDRTRDDGSDVGPWIQTLFEVLNTPEKQRQTKLDADLKQFSYINGDLFAARLPVAAFDKDMREKLLVACDFKWDAISPAIFGSLFQSVMNAKERRAAGAHYTTEKNILKLIQPLFLDELWADFERLRQRRDTSKNKLLREFQDRLAGLRFLDPACGCGNFLIIAYRELRVLETEVLKALNPKGQRQLLDVALLSKVDVNQFYGIEIGEFPARIAEVALWMMDHIMNVRLSLEFGQAYARIPLVASPHIRHGDALEVDWAALLSPAECSYVLGNPPFIGAKYQTDEQRGQVRRIAALGGSGGTLDFVAAWFLKAGAYVGKSTATIGFVATNSITQGEQVAQLWPLLFDRYKLEVAFAHRTFAWGSDARGVAHVHVVIIGLAKAGHEPKTKRLFSYSDINGDPIESGHQALSPYLFDASGLSNRHLVIEETSKSLCDMPKMIIGSKPIDGGYLIFDDAERDDFLSKEPSAKRFMRPFIGGVEYLHSRGRSILALQDATPSELRNMPLVIKRLKEVREYRRGERPAKKKADTEPKPPGISARKLADTPAQFHVTVLPVAPFLAVPENSSETRQYLPIGWLEPPIIPSNKLRFIKDADLWHFGILTSRMHVAWLRYVGGKIKSDFQYSIGIVYNAFPWPTVAENQQTKIRTLAKAIIDNRNKFEGCTLAELYDSTIMKPQLLKAHQALDVAVDRLYRGTAFTSDRERVEHLFGVYERMTAPLEVIAAAPKPRPRQR